MLCLSCPQISLVHMYIEELWFGFLLVLVGGFFCFPWVKACSNSFGLFCPAISQTWVTAGLIIGGICKKKLSLGSVIRVNITVIEKRIKKKKPRCLCIASQLVEIFYYMGLKVKTPPFFPILFISFSSAKSLLPWMLSEKKTLCLVHAKPKMRLK